MEVARPSDENIPKLHAVDLKKKRCQHADCKKLGVEAAPGRAQKKGKKAAAKPKKRPAPAATQERAPKRKASSARATAPAKAAKAPKVGRGGAKKKAAT